MAIRRIEVIDVTDLALASVHYIDYGEGIDSLPGTYSILSADNPEHAGWRVEQLDFLPVSDASLSDVISVGTLGAGPSILSADNPADGSVMAVDPLGTQHPTGASIVNEIGEDILGGEPILPDDTFGAQNPTSGPLNVDPLGAQHPVGASLVDLHTAETLNSEVLEDDTFGAQNPPSILEVLVFDLPEGPCE